MSKPEIKNIPDYAYSPQEDEVELSKLFGVIWDGKWLVVCITMIFAISSVYYSLSIPDEYESSVILAPSSNSNSSSLSKLSGQFGGLASLAGVSLGGPTGVDQTTIAIELIKTWGFLETFIKRNELEVELFAVKGWDKRNNKLLFNGDIYDEEISAWVDPPPTSWELFNEIQNKFSISQDVKTGLISLKVEHYSPYIAKKWADLLVAAINKYMQDKDREEALNSINYLKRQIGKTNIAEMRSIFFQLIEEQTKTLMLAEISDEYIFKTLSVSKVAEQKSKPKRALKVILGTILGGMLAVFIVLIRHLLSNKKD